jgi:hypothetical protein
LCWRCWGAFLRAFPNGKDRRGAAKAIRGMAQKLLGDSDREVI